MTEEEGCEICQLSVGVGMALNVCGDIEKDIDVCCSDLYDSIESGERTPDEVVDVLINKTRDNKKAHRMLVDLKESMHTPLEAL